MIHNLLQNIRNQILQIQNIQSSWIYPAARCDVIAPAVFLEIANYEPGNDPATEELALIANIEARVVVDATIENAELVCQALACDIANVAHLNSFGCAVSPATVTGISRDAFKPEFDAYICWLVEWQHEFHKGESVWNDPGIPPHILHINQEVIDDKQ